MKKIEKNRYLELNGEPVGVPAWKRLVTSWAFAASITGAVVASNSMADDAKNKIPLSSAFFGAAIGLACRSFVKITSKFLLNDMIGRDLVIDTKPSLRQQGISKPKTYLYSFVSGGCGGIIPPYSVFKSFQDSSSSLPAVACFAITTPYLCTSAEFLYYTYKVGSGKWKIIKRADMELEKETAMEEKQQGQVAPQPV